MFPGINRKGMTEVDRIMTEDFSIGVDLMMEQAGENLARIATKFIEGKDVIIVCGNGNNGGGGLVAARRLASWGFYISIWLPKGEPANNFLKNQLSRAKSVGALVLKTPPTIKKELVIDAFIGYNYVMRSIDESSEVFNFLRGSNPICLDIPSGVDADTGKSIGKIMPLATATLAWPKLGLLNLTDDETGRIFLIDIGIPMNVWGKIIETPLDKNSLQALQKQFNISSYIEIIKTEVGWAIS